MRRLVVLLVLASAPAFADKTLDRADAANVAWGQCVVSGSTIMAKKAAPETVVEAAFGQCLGEEQEFRKKLTLWSSHGGWTASMSTSELEQQMDIQRRRIRQAALAALLAL